MFGTIARVTVQQSKEDEFLAINGQWARERGARVGEVAGYVLKAEGRQEHFIVAIFSDRDTYYANANDPETDRWYRLLRATLGADPEWKDCEVIQADIRNGV